MRYKAILFDLDGTLLDTTRGVINAVKRTIADNGFPMPDEERLKTFVGPPMQRTMGEVFHLDGERALRTANEFRENYRKYSLFEASVYDGILPLLEELRKEGCMIAVATNKSHQNAVDILERFGIAQYCDYIRGSDLEGKLSKKDIINMCIEHLHCKKKETVLVGDSIFDLQGAEEAGIDFVAVTYGFGFKPNEKAWREKSAFTANNVKELRHDLLYG